MKTLKYCSPLPWRGIMNDNGFFIEDANGDIVATIATGIIGKRFTEEKIVANLLRLLNTNNTGNSDVDEIKIFEEG